MAAPTHPSSSTRSPAARVPRPPLYSSPRAATPPGVSSTSHTAAQKCVAFILRPQLFPAPPFFFSLASNHATSAPPPENTNDSIPSPFIRGRGKRAEGFSLACGVQLWLARVMCHPGLPPLPPGCPVSRRRDRRAGIDASPPAAALEQPTPARHDHAQPPQYHCVCSPTAHRGSFRCRWHRSSYEWGRRRP